MRANLVRGFKKTACVFTLGMGLVLTGGTVHATSAQPAEVVTTESTTEAVAKNKAKMRSVLSDY